MVQELHVVKCFSCETFQTQIVKKTNTWECKVCGIKQSIKKVYGRGSGKDCRLHTQKLNALRGASNDSKTDCEENCTSTQPSHAHSQTIPAGTDDQLSYHKTSKWAAFIDLDVGDHSRDYFIDFKQRKAQRDSLGLNASGSANKRRRVTVGNPVEELSRGCDSYNGDLEVPTTSTERITKGFTYGKYNAYNTEDMRDDSNINDMTEGRDEVRISQTCKEREIARKNREPTSSGKWGKYLVNQEDDEDRFDGEENSFVSKSNVCMRESKALSCETGSLSHSIVDTEPPIMKHLVSSKNGAIDCKQSINLKNGIDNNGDSKHVKASLTLSRDDNEMKTIQPSDRSTNHSELENVTCALSEKVFEQGYDLSDTELELNF